MAGLRRLAAGVTAVALSALGLRGAERWLLYPAPPAPSERPAPSGDARHAWLDTEGGRVEAFLLLPHAPRPPGPLLVYAHGNGELVDWWLDELEGLRRSGVAVLLVEYPGYGRSTGSPSERSIQAALAAGLDWALGQAPLDPARVVGHGRSLGGGAVCALARVRPLAALVLESTFTSIADVAREAFRMPRFLVSSGYDNLGVVAAHRGPVLVLHGEGDRSIPVAQARRLAAAAAAASLEILPCGHNDCPSPWPRVEAFLRDHGLL